MCVIIIIICRQSCRSHRGIFYSHVLFRCKYYNSKTPLDVLLYLLRVLIHNTKLIQNYIKLIHNSVVYYTTNYNAQCVKHYNKTYLLFYIIIVINSFYCNDIVRIHRVYLRVAGQSRFVRLLLFTSRAHNDIIIERYECRTEYAQYYYYMFSSLSYILLL